VLYSFLENRYTKKVSPGHSDLTGCGWNVSDVLVPTVSAFGKNDETGVESRLLQ